MTLLAWGLLAGFIVSVVVTWWPISWQFAPGIIFGVAVALYFGKEMLRAPDHRLVNISKLLGFVVLSYFAYALSLFEAKWVLGANGFATFSSYNSTDALPALFVACFVGCCIGAFILAVGLRLMFIRFDLIRGLFLFAIFSGTLGSTIVVGFEMFGFVPQFLFPVWALGVTAIVLYLRSAEQQEEV